MQKQIQLILFSTLALLHIGCGGGSTSNNVETEDSDIVLKKSESVTCSQATSFSVNPTENPSVSFSQNVDNGEVTITLNDNSSGFVTVQNCTKV